MNQNHINLITEYMDFARFQRNQHVKSLQIYFKNIVEDRLLEGMYTSEEVEGILKDLCSCICGEIESELVTMCHMNVLLLRQLFRQAEREGLTLKGNISEMQNGDLLEQIRAQDGSMNVSRDKLTLDDDLTACEFNADAPPPLKQSTRDSEAAYENLKKILSKKNEVIKDLRERLRKYEQPTD